MPRYLSQHTMACLTRQGAQELTARLHAAQSVQARRVLIAMHGGKMFVEFDAQTREELEAWLQKEKFHFDWLIRIDYESTGTAGNAELIAI